MLALLLLFSYEAHQSIIRLFGMTCTQEMLAVIHSDKRAFGEL